ncbi:CG7550 [Drosophila busckii]|uniref:CG7550 n=1 Tax=Drosophila busckii TaxID=30019 RepID=A0A0M4E8X3_DROBS|nr:2-aminoethanethiol dioxygenase [Drosophila busckii]ALC43428.1 CG7550 [Drosophila busckii]
MSAHFQCVLRQAFKTFQRDNLASFNANLQQLKQLTDQLTYRDLHINEGLFRDDVPSIERAPCIYMPIFEDENFSMSLFILRANSCIPLHDHPVMYGLLRGLWGQLKVQSYTQQLGSQESLVYDKNLTHIKVNAEEPSLITADTVSALLTPRKRNYHQITQLGSGVAAFFDILSPPYDANMPQYGPRRCRFYRPKTDVDGQMELQRIPSPTSYYCDLAETPDTVLKCGFICANEAHGSHVTDMQ